MTRKRWLLEQIRKCDELIEEGMLNEFQSALVHVLRVDFKDSLIILEQRKDDGDIGCCDNVIHLPRKRG